MLNSQVLHCLLRKPCHVVGEFRLKLPSALISFHRARTPVHVTLFEHRFLPGLEKGEPEVVAQGWQKDYMQTAKDKKPLARPFANENVVDRAKTGGS